MSATFQIGDFQFINLSRHPGRPHEHVSLERKPGNDGTTVWQTGKAGEPFTCISSVNPPDVAAGESLLVQYQALIGQNPVAMKWANINQDAIRVLVLDVQPMDHGLFATLTSVGGVAAAGANTAGFLYAVWTLLPIDAAQQP